MAIFHMNFQNISAGKMKSAVASASYRSGELLYSEREQKGYWYRRSVTPEAFILTPEHAPEWASDRQRLWNEVEKRDRNANSRYAKEFNVALPIELSHDEQKALITQYVQETFVDKGMVADIAIHRDHEDNPHAHVMLTNRPFNPDGTWGLKAKKEYILDAHGNKTYTENGHAKSRKIWLVDWDKKEKIGEWRTAWANAVNRTFEAKNMPDRISEKSYEEQGLNEVPTQHEGINSQREQRKEWNEAVQELRTDKAEYSNTKEKFFNQYRVEALKQYTSFHEKAVFSRLSKELHMYIDLENLEDKRRMLFNWKNSTLIKGAIGEEVTKKMQLINQQEASLKEADELLNTIVERSVKGLYGESVAESLTALEQRQLIRETESENHVFKGEVLEERLGLIRADVINQQILAFTKRPFVSIKNMNLRDEALKEKMDKVLAKTGQSVEDLNIRPDLSYYSRPLEACSERDRKLIQSAFKTLEANREIREVALAQYNQLIQKSFPDCDLNALTTTKKERLYNALVYFNPHQFQRSEVTINNLLNNPPTMFTSKDHKQGLAYFNGNLPLEKVESMHLRNVLRNKGAVQLFFDECSEDKSIKSSVLKQARTNEKAEHKTNENYREETLNTYGGLDHREESRQSNLSRLFDQALFAILYSPSVAQNRKRLAKEKELEKAMRKKYKGRGNEPEEGMGLHL